MFWIIPDRQVQIAKMVLVCLLPIVTLAAISGSQLVTSINERTVATELGTMIQYSIELGRLIHTYAMKTLTLVVLNI